MNSVFKRSLLLSLAFFSLCSALIEPADPFNAIEDARSLREALTGHDPLNDVENNPLAITDSRAEVITDILTRRSGAQRVAIAEAYNSTYSSTLVEDFEAQLGGDFRDLMVVMVTPLALYYFNELWYDAHPFLPGSRALVEILTTTPNAVLVAVADEGAKYFLNNKLRLPAVLDTMYQGLTFQMINRALAGTHPDTQEVDVDAAIADAKYLNEYGTNSNGFRRSYQEKDHIEDIFVSRSYKQLRQVFEEYTKLFGHDIEEAIEGRGLRDTGTSILNLNPCLYIMRFANKLQFGSKAHEVSMTALRIVQRMKKDSIHSGRRPTGLCGAALLIAARMHEYSRTIVDIVRIVKIHESTLRKRLTEFADTPSSSLTLDEFMSVDLEAEQDPPAFKAARKKDRDRIKEIGEFELTALQKEIDLQLEQDFKRSQRYRRIGVGDDFEDEETADFIGKSNIDAIQECLAAAPDLATAAPQAQKLVQIEGLKPDIESMCRTTASELQELENSKNNQETDELTLEGLDDEEINNYILTHEEAERKNAMWKTLNAEYLKEMREKEERLAKEREEGKPEKKKRRSRKKVIGPSTTAGEAIEKMLQEKKISTKINYDILKTLTEGGASSSNVTQGNQSETIIKEEIGKDEHNIKPTIDINALPVIEETGPINTKQGRGKPSYSIGGPSAKIPKLEMGLPVAEPDLKPDGVIVENDDLDDEDANAEDEIEPEPEPEKEYSSLKDMLNEGHDEDDYYGYDDDNY